MAGASVNVLLIEDSKMDSHLLGIFLRESRTTHYNITQVERLAAGLERLRNARFDVILSDLTLPDSHGFETFAELHRQAPDVPILLLSGLDDESLAVRAVREGAQDYLVKGRIDAYVLGRAINHAIERHRAEAALEESERHYKHLLESITDYSYSVTLADGQPTSSRHGPGCVAVTGYAPDEYATDSDLWLKMVHENDRETVLAQVQVVRSGQTPAPVEHRIRHKSGQIRWVRNAILPQHNREGQLVGYDGLVSDITERKQAEEKLVASEAFYHSLVENLPQFILRKDLDERFTFANERFCQMLGKPLSEIIGKTDFDFYPPELAAKYQRDDHYVMATGATFEVVEENITTTGEKIYVHVVKTAIRNARSRIIGIQGIFWDITERKRWEERLQKANEELARSHKELKSAQLQLIQAEKMESIGTLAAGVAHEVKNPLAIMLMGVSFLTKRTADDEAAAQVLREMKEAIERADKITRGLLDFSASQQLAVEPADLNVLIDETVGMVRHEMNKNGINMARHFGVRLPRVPVDKRQIQQVFVNVFMNAIHAMPTGGTLTIRTFLKEMTETSHFEGSRKLSSFYVGDRVVVAEVEDTGTGIPEENLAKIFDPFFTTKPTGVGTGLGLPVSKKIIELHGGALEVKNRSEGGARVSIVLKPERTER